MALNKKTIGNFTPYFTEDIKSFLEKEYAINVGKLNLYTNALDNTVLDIDNNYILKIYETKQSQNISLAIDFYQRFQKYYCIDLCRTVNGQYLSTYMNKPVVCYKKSKGRRSAGLCNNLIFFKRFHQSESYWKELNLEEEISKIKSQISFYLPPSLKEMLIKRKRYYRYKAVLNQLEKINTGRFFKATYGITHGDCNPNNLLTCKGKYHFIDFDNIGYDYQIYDLVSFLLKYKETPSIRNEKCMLNKYYFKTQRDVFDDTYNIINLFCCYKGLEMILSTEYYCFIVNKFSECVLDKFFLTNLDKLYNNIKIRLKELK